MSQRPKWTFLQGRHPDGHTAREKMLSITVREMPIKTAIRYYQLTPPQNGHPWKSYKDNGCGERGDRDSSCSVGGDGGGWVRPQGKQ